jgi:hypothetical protein
VALFVLRDYLACAFTAIEKKAVIFLFAFSQLALSVSRARGLLFFVKRHKHDARHLRTFAASKGGYRAFGEYKTAYLWRLQARGQIHSSSHQIRLFAV